MCCKLTDISGCDRKERLVVKLRGLAMVPYDHIWYKCADAVEELAKPIFDELGLSFFRFYKLYKDGSCIRLSNNSGWTDLYLRNDYLNLTPPESAFIESGKSICLLEKCPNPGLRNTLDLCKQHYGLQQGLSIMKPMDDCIMIYDFSTANADAEDLPYKYLEKFGLIEDFLKYFHIKGNSLLIDAEKHKVQRKDFIYPELDNKLVFDNSPRSVEFRVKNHFVRITKREVECLYYLVRGYSTKHIANLLNISPKTVEHYICVLKTKFQCDRNRLIDMVQKKKDIKDLLSYFSVG